MKKLLLLCLMALISFFASAQYNGTYVPIQKGDTLVIRQNPTLEQIQMYKHAVDVKELSQEWFIGGSITLGLGVAGLLIFSEEFDMDETPCVISCVVGGLGAIAEIVGLSYYLKYLRLSYKTKISMADNGIILSF